MRSSLRLFQAAGQGFGRMLSKSRFGEVGGCQHWARGQGWHVWDYSLVDRRVLVSSSVFVMVVTCNML